MAIISSLFLFIVGVIGAAMARVLAEDLKEWTPFIVEKLIQLALSKLPCEHQDRFAEEWRSHVNDVPGQTAKLWVAVGFNLAVLKIRLKIAYLGFRRKLSTSILSISLLCLVLAVLCVSLVGKIFRRTGESTAKPSAEEAAVMLVLLVGVFAAMSSKSVRYKLS